MSRKGNRGKRRQQQPEATSWAYAIARNWDMDQKVADDIMLKLRIAYQCMRDGKGDDGDFDKLASALNVGLVRAEAIGQPAADAIGRALRALLDADGLRQRHGRYGFTGPGILDMNAGLDLYGEILGKSTPRQMQEAVIECDRRIRVGEVQTA